MTPAIPLLIALALALTGWLTARSRAWAFQRATTVTGAKGRLHSLPSYHGWFVGLCAGIPAGLFAIVWAATSPALVVARVLRHPAAAQIPAFGINRDTILAEA
ncbi:MAG: phosphate ABC transporter permease family protein, partial [Novosphingobium sp.]